MCTVCDLWTGFLFRITQRTFVVLPPREVRVQWFSNSLILRACWKIKYLAPILHHSDSVVLEWDLGISIFNKLQKWFKRNWSGNHWARLFEEAFLFFTVGNIFNGHSSDFTFWDGRYHFASWKRGKLRKLESHFNVKIWESENLYTRVSSWSVY